jgi:hypothetical protein
MSRMIEQLEVFTFKRPSHHPDHFGGPVYHSIDTWLARAPDLSKSEQSSTICA